MNVGMVDVDNWGKLNSCFPNLGLMKLSAHHKSHGDSVEWYNPDVHYDRVYKSKIFSFTKEPFKDINADEIIYGGTGYCISMVGGVEVFNKSKNIDLPYEIEHIYPDYSLYGITDTAYGFMSRGCPRGCGFCHVKDKEGLRSHKVADLSEFWRGQKKIELMDPNTLACPDWKDILQQLIDSKAMVNINQGADIRLMTEEKAEMLMKIKLKHVHFAFDRYEDKKYVMPKLKQFAEVTGWKRSKVSVYILVNYNTTIEQDLERIYFVRSLGFHPYVMRYDKEHIPRGHKINALARWCNFVPLFWKYETFEEYWEHERKGSIRNNQIKLWEE